MDKAKLYTLPWSAMQIARLSADPKVDALALSQIEILSQLLEEPIPEEFRPPEPPRPSLHIEEAAPTKKRYPLGEKSCGTPKPWCALISSVQHRENTQKATLMVR